MRQMRFGRLLSLYNIICLIGLVPFTAQACHLLLLSSTPELRVALPEEEDSVSQKDGFDFVLGNEKISVKALQTNQDFADSHELQMGLNHSEPGTFATDLLEWINNRFKSVDGNGLARTDLNITKMPDQFIRATHQQHVNGIYGRRSSRVSVDNQDKFMILRMGIRQQGELVGVLTLYADLDLDLKVFPDDAAAKAGQMKAVWMNVMLRSPAVETQLLDETLSQGALYALRTFEANHVLVRANSNPTVPRSRYIAAGFLPVSPPPAMISTTDSASAAATLFDRQRLEGRR